MNINLIVCSNWMGDPAACYFRSEVQREAIKGLDRAISFEITLMQSHMPSSYLWGRRHRFKVSLELLATLNRQSLKLWVFQLMFSQMIMEFVFTPFPTRCGRHSTTANIHTLFSPGAYIKSWILKLLFVYPEQSKFRFLYRQLSSAYVGISPSKPVYSNFNQHTRSFRV